MNAVLTRPMTAAEFSQLPDVEELELVRGEVVKTMPPGGVHGAIAAIVSMLLRLWMRAGASGGYVGVEAGYRLTRDPDTVRGPDVSYVRPERIPASDIPEGFWELAPDLAVEVVSPHETADNVRAKVRDFLLAGTPLFWLVYPRTQEVVVHTADGLARTYGVDATLTFPDLMPGFTCSVAELFE